MVSPPLRLCSFLLEMRKQAWHVVGEWGEREGGRGVHNSRARQWDSRSLKYPCKRTLGISDSDCDEIERRNDLTLFRALCGNYIKTKEVEDKGERGKSVSRW